LFDAGVEKIDEQVINNDIVLFVAANRDNIAVNLDHLSGLAIPAHCPRA
jgi:hypothetical protein